jgi:hypothetical protein
VLALVVAVVGLVLVVPVPVTEELHRRRHARPPLVGPSMIPTESRNSLMPRWTTMPPRCS